MSASHWCRSRGLLVQGLRFACCILLSSYIAAHADATCTDAEVIAHVRDQYMLYGPQSQKHEYFGFIYRYRGTIESSLMRSTECRGVYKCTLNTAAAAARIPKGAQVLGEWHTHPHIKGSRSLSANDVRGAHNNHRLRCYAAFYSGPTGNIYRWEPRSSSVPVAMASRVELGNYLDMATPDPGSLYVTAATD